MPFTPFHFGPGALFKAIGRDRFSFLIFCGSQVLMDVEPLVRMIRRDAVLHGPSHTLIGAFVIALVATGIGRPAGNLLLHLLGSSARSISWKVALLSAMIGSYSHVALDAIMHGDMHPLLPLTSGNPLLGGVSLATLHLGCVLAGMTGGAILLVRALRRI